MSRFGHSKLVLAAVTLLAIGVGCGGGGEGGSTSVSEVERARAEASAAADVARDNRQVEREYAESRQAAEPTSEEKEAGQVATGFYAILEEDEAVGDSDKAEIDSASFCDLMSEGAQAQTIRYAKVSSGIARQWDCESAVEMLATRSERAGANFGEAEVIGVNVHGDRATATVRFGDRGVASSVSLVREDSEWKLAGNPVPDGS